MKGDKRSNEEYILKAEFWPPSNDNIKTNTFRLFGEGPMEKTRKKHKTKSNPKTLKRKTKKQRIKQTTL